MRHTRRRIGILVIGLACAVWPEQAAAVSETVKKTISANESYLKRFRKEREALASAQDEASVKKRASLDQKIKNLEAENARLSGAPSDRERVKKAVDPPAEPVDGAPLFAAGSAVSEWEKLTREQKELYVQALVEGLKKEGKTIERHPLFYTALMDYVFVSDSALAAKPLKEAVLATIRKNEASLKTLKQS